MTVTRGTVYAICRGLAVGVLSAVVVLPVASADPQECDTVGDSVDSYLSRHPDIKAELTAKAQSESPGSPNALLDYLNRHPDVRQSLITLSQQCVG